MFRSNLTIELQARAHQRRLLEQAAEQRCIAELPRTQQRRTWRFWRIYSLRPAAPA